MGKTVTLYYSSVPGSVKIRKETTRVNDILSARKVQFEKIDVTQENHKDVMLKESGKNELPQIFVDGVFKGLCEDLENANEDNAVNQFLGV